MNSSDDRFIQSRFGLPCLWAAGAAFPAFLTRAARPDRIVASAARDAYQTQDAYYVVSHFHYALSIAAAFVVFAGMYLGLSLLLPRFRRAFGLIHFGLMMAGTALIYAPQFLLAWPPWSRRYGDPQSVFAFWNTLSTAGYALTLAGVGFLVAAVTSGIRQRTRSIES